MRLLLTTEKLNYLKLTLFTGLDCLMSYFRDYMPINDEKHLCVN